MNAYIDYLKMLSTSHKDDPNMLYQITDDSDNKEYGKLTDSTIKSIEKAIYKGKCPVKNRRNNHFSA